MEQVVGSAAADLTSFVGRRYEMTQTKRMLSTFRVVTLTGPGGVGKTRLAFRVADQLSRTFRDGVWRVELAELRDPTLLPNMVADNLGLRDQSDRAPMDTVVTYLKDRTALLVLDNCEHLVGACAEFVNTLLLTCPEVRVLATSRQSLRVAGEGVWPIPALPLPDPDNTLSVEQLAHTDAIRLFVDRASAVQPGFAVNGTNASVLARVCRHLDGIPLAIELAAVWLRALSLPQIDERLSERFRFLRMQRRGAPARHQTLRALIDWSYELCAEQEQLVWARASVFSGGFDLDAVEYVCGGGGVEPDEILEVVHGLVDKSIFVQEEHEGIVRYRMLETIREYGHGRLVDADDRHRVRVRHRDWYADLAARFEAEWLSFQQASWVHRLRRDHANLRLALEFCVTEPDQAREAMRMVALIDDHWTMRGFLTEARQWLDRALATDPEPSPERVSALRQNGWYALLRGELEVGPALLTEAAELAQHFEIEAEQAYLRHAWGMLALFTNDVEKAGVLFDEALTRFRAAGSMRGELFTLFILGYTLGLQGIERGWAVFDEVITATTRQGEMFWRSWALWGLAHVEVVCGHVKRAEVAATDALRLQRLLDNRLGMAFCVDTLAWIAESYQRHSRAATLFGAADTLWHTVGASPALSAPVEATHDEYRASARAALGDSAFERAYANGGALSIDLALDYALDQRKQVEEALAEPIVGPGRLTRREREVAELVAQGLVNKEIARNLVISQRTAEAHVEHILVKLGFTSRAQIASWVVEGKNSDVREA